MRLLLPLLCTVALSAATADNDYQKYDDAMLGINMTPPSSSTQTANGTDPNTGVEVQAVYPGTAAAAMGAKPGDLIISMNGGQIGSMNDLRNEVALTGVGGQATVEVLRNGQKLVLTETLGEWPKNIPREPIDEAAERRFRDWQSRRLDRTQNAVSNLKKQVEDLERRAQAAAAPAAPTGPVSPAQAMAMPAAKALMALPAYHITLRLAHDAPDAGDVKPGRQVAWDARVLIGTPAPPIL